MSAAIENARVEHSTLRQEILHSDRTCLLLMGYLIGITGAAGSAFIISGNSFTGWILSPIWIIGFCYLTEKRFVIKRNGLYIEKYIEKNQEGFEWQSFLSEARRDGKIRPALPWGPYYLEAVVSGLVITGIPIAGAVKLDWEISSFYFLSTSVLLLIFVYLMTRTIRAYRSYCI